MPNNFVGHIDKWLLLSESDIDFATLFVRAWIPFNAWYCNNYQDTRDRYCLDLMKEDSNHFRANLVALLGNNDPAAINFKNYLGQLHDLLERHPIPEASIDKRITFKNLWFRLNPQISTSPPKRIRGIEYKAERLANNSINANIIDTRTAPNPTLYTYTNSSYNLTHFENDITNNIYSANKKDTILACFKEIDPKKKENLLTDNRRDAIKIGDFYFIPNAHLLSQAVIEVLYNLRNKLFHGELQPSRDNLTVYEPAYHVLRVLLKSLR